MVVLGQQQGKHAQRVFTYKGKTILKAGSTAWRKALDREGIRRYMEKDKRTKNSRYPHHPDDDYRFSDFRWHDLRHTWASWHVQAGTPIHVLQELGGWSDIRMVQKYAHLAPEHLAENADLLSLKVVDFNSHTLSGTPVFSVWSEARSMFPDSAYSSKSFWCRNRPLVLHCIHCIQRGVHQWQP